MTDVVTYTAPCPSCGGDATWTSHRRGAPDGGEYYRPDGAPLIEVHGNCSDEGVA